MSLVQKSVEDKVIYFSIGTFTCAFMKSDVQAHTDGAVFSNKTST